MSTNLSTDSSQASDSNLAATASSATADNSAASAAEPSAERTDDVAASGTDASIDDLDKQYRENLRAADKPDDVEAQPVEPKPKETVEAKPDGQPEVTEPEVDELEEQTGPRTIEQLKKQFPRVSDKPLEEIARLDDELVKAQTELASVGGPVGLEIAKAMLPALLSANPSQEDTDGVFQAMTETNPALVQAMSWSILTHSLNEESLDPASGKPINIVTGDAIIKQYLNENYDVEKLEKLISFDEAGLLDHEALEEELKTYSGKSDYVRELEARLKAVEDKGKQDAADQEGKKQARINEHVAKTEKYISDGAMTQIVAIAEEYGWTATKEELNSSDPVVKEFAEFKIALGDLLTPWLNNFLRSHNKWGGIESIGKREEAFNLDGNPTKLLKSNGDDLISAAVAAFKSRVRVMNKSFQRMAGSSRNVRLKKQLTTRSGAVEPSEIPPVKKPEENGNRGNTIDELDRAYRETVRGQRASL